MYGECCNCGRYDELEESIIGWICPKCWDKMWEGVRE